MRNCLLLCFFTLISVSSFCESTPTDAPLIIGIDADFSSVAVQGGVAIKRGVELAVDEINANGGVLGRELKVVARDHRGNPARGMNNIAQFANTENIIAVVGGVHSPVAMEELEVIHRNNLLFLIPWAAATALVDNPYSPNNIFRISVRDADAGKFLIKQAKSEGLTRVSLVLERTGWGRSNERSLTEAALDNGVTIQSTHWINWQQHAFVDDVSKIKQALPDAVILVTNAPEGAVVINEFVAQGLTTMPILSHWGIASGNFVKQLNEKPEALNLSVLQTFHADYQRNPIALQLLDAYFQKYGLVVPEDIPGITGLAHAYDLVHLLALAISKAESTDTDKVRLALETIESYSGAVKHYLPAFSSTQHDALSVTDYFMASFNNEGGLTIMDKH